MRAVAVVPAAGRSRRMGRPKGELAWGEGTVLGAVARALREGGCAEVVVVTRPGQGVPADVATVPGCRVAVNPEPERGMLASVLAGVEALGGSAGAARRGGPLLVCPADHPALDPATVRRLLEEARAAPDALLVPAVDGRRGHPLVVPPELVGELAGLDPAVGLRQLLERRAGRVREVPVRDRGAVADLDTPGDYARSTAGG